MAKNVNNDQLKLFHDFFKTTKPNKDYPSFVKNVLCDIFENDSELLGWVYEQFMFVVSKNLGTSFKEKIITAITDDSKYEEFQDDILKRINELQAKSDLDLKLKIVEAIKEIEQGIDINGLKEKIDNIFEFHNNPVDELINNINNHEKYKAFSHKDKSKYMSGFRFFSTTLFGFYRANTWLQKGQNDFLLCQLIAENTLFASQEIVNQVKKGELGADRLRKEDLKAIRVKGENKYASWDYMAHARKVGKNKNKLCTDEYNVRITKELQKEYSVNDSIIGDDNTCANLYIKRAILKSYQAKFENNDLFLKGSIDLFQDYEACHVWDIPYDRRYYASIANLVLVPRALAQLTDHCDAVKQLLRYEVWQRFEFKPDEVKTEPSIDKKLYKKIRWRDGSTADSKF